MSETNTNQSSPDLNSKVSKSMLHYSSGDDGGLMMMGGGDQTMEGGASTANSSFNNTLGPSSAPVVTKRKYQKRKKPPVVEGGGGDVTVVADASTPAGSAGLTKVEGTKLIIQKKAFKLALKSAAAAEGDYMIQHLKSKYIYLKFRNKHVNDIRISIFFVFS